MILAFLLVLLIPSLADAACSGAGLTWTCTSGSTIANVNSAISSGTDGMTITLDAGSYTWTSGTVSLDNAKGATLACASQGACTITQATNTVIELAFSGTNTKFYRITGMAFTQTGASECGTCIWFYPASAGTTAYLTQFRIDHNSWSGYVTSNAPALTFFGRNDAAGFFYGLIDHNTVTGTNDMMIAKILGHNYGVGGTDWIALSSLPVPQVRGTANNIFIEDNIFNITDGFSNVACIDTHQMAAFVTRYNTLVNCRGLDTHAVPHGGMNNWEAYRNDITKTNVGDTWSDCQRCIFNQGSGQMFVFDNRITPAGASVSSSAMSFVHHRSNTDAPGFYGICDGTKSVDGNTAPEATHRGYPCLAQPGRTEVGGTPSWGKLSPIAAFRNINTKDNSKVDIIGTSAAAGSPDYFTNHIQEGRDYLNAVSATAQTSATSPFDGTTGIGHGTLANRPTTCTHTTAPDGDEGGGVMYWATDQGSWNASGDGRGSGVLYRCSATNTWTVHYTPYTYPHPLQGFVAATGSGSGLKGGKGLGLF